MYDFGGYVIRLCTNNETPVVISNCHFENARTYAIFIYGPAENDKLVYPAAFGINNPNSVFIEDSTFIDVQGHHVAGFSGSNITFRYNTITRNGTGIDGHAYGYGVGCGYGGTRDIYGHYLYEMYNNKWTNSSTEYCIRVRSGTAMITDNDFNCKSAVTLVIEDKIVEGVSPDEVTGSDGKIYTVTWPHTATIDTKPPTGMNWREFWREAGSNGGTWTSGKYYRPRCYEQSGCPQSDDSIFLPTRDDAPDLCYSTPNQWWIWNNNHTYQGDGKKLMKLDEASTGKSGCIREDKEYYLREPKPGDPVEGYEKFTYPHPITQGWVPPDEAGEQSGALKDIDSLRIVPPEEN